MVIGFDRFREAFRDFANPKRKLVDEVVDWLCGRVERDWEAQLAKQLQLAGYRR